MYNLLSALLGGLIAVMITFNGTLASSVGNFTSSIIIHLTGLIAIIAVLILSKSKLKLDRTIPFYLYSAGAIGVFAVIFNNLSFSALGISITLALGLFGQTISSIIIDHFGLLGMKVVKFEKKKLIGLAIITLGILVMTFF